VVTPTQQRAAADYLVETYGISQRHASRLLGRSRSTLRYRRRPRSGEAALIRAIRRLAKRHPRYGYKRIRVRLIRQGWRVNLKRVRSRRAGMERVGLAATAPSQKAQENRAITGVERQQLREPAGAVQERRMDVRLHHGSDGGRKFAQVAIVG